MGFGFHNKELQFSWTFPDLGVRCMLMTNMFKALSFIKNLFKQQDYYVLNAITIILQLIHSSGFVMYTLVYQIQVTTIKLFPSPHPLEWCLFSTACLSFFKSFSLQHDHFLAGIKNSFLIFYELRNFLPARLFQLALKRNTDFFSKVIFYFSYNNNRVIGHFSATLNIEGCFPLLTDYISDKDRRMDCCYCWKASSDVVSVIWYCDFVNPVQRRMVLAEIYMHPLLKAIFLMRYPLAWME